MKQRMAKFRFRQFKVYGDIRLLRKQMKEMTKIQFPKEELFSLTKQMWRAMDSIVLNIAEGSDRGTDKDFAHFLNTANTSLNEVVACLDLAMDDKYITENQLNEYIKKLSNVSDQLNALRKKILENPTK